MSEEYVFNGSIATLERIDALLVMLHSANISGANIQSMKILDALYKEVYPLLKESEKESGNAQRILMLKSVFINSNKELVLKESAFVNIHTFDFWVRNQLNKKGLLMKKGEDSGLAYR